MARGRRVRQEAFSDDENEDREDVVESDDDNLGVSAATAISQPSKMPRYSMIASFQAGSFDKSNIIQPLNQMKDILLNLIHRLKANKEEVDNSLLQTWKERILTLTKKIITIQLQYQYMDTITNNYLNDYIEKENNHIAAAVASSTSSSSSSSSSAPVASTPQIPNITRIVQDINEKIEEELKKLNVLDDDYYKKVQQICKKIAATAEGEEENEEELEILDNGEEATEASLRCPYTLNRIVEPMKNCNPNLTQRCIHVVSKAGITALLSGKSAIRCPVAGCNGRWVKNHVALDEIFELKLKRFERQQKLQTQILGQTTSQSQRHPSAHSAIAIDDD